MRLKRGLRLTVASMSLVTGILMGGCSGSSEVAENKDAPAPSPDIVATFSGEALTLAEFEKRYAKSVGGWDAAVDDSLAEYEDFLGRYVDFRLKVLDAIEAGLNQDSALVAEIQGYEEQLARPYLVEREITEDLVRELFDRRALEVSASHILVRIPDSGSPADTLAAYQRMQALRDSVLAGADFADIAYRNSDDPSAKRNRGYLGTFTAGRMIYPFEERAYSTPVGEMSEIFRTQYGYHLLYVHDRRPRTPDIAASHILIRVPDGDTAAALAKVAEVQAELDAGEPFAEVAREYSEDPGSASRGGRLGMFGRGRMVPPFEEAAFGLESVGDRSEWFNTRFGYHIVQLDSIGELPTFEEAYDDLKSRVQRLPRFERAEAELGEQYRQRLKSTIDTAAVDSLTERFPADSILYYLALEKWDEDARAVEIAVLGPKRFTLGDFVEYGMVNRAASPQSYDRAHVFRLIDRMLDENVLDAAAMTLEERDPEFAELMNEYRDGIVLFRVMEDSVWNKAAQDSAGLAAHYAENASRYTFSERTRVISIFASSDSLLKVVAESWQPGDSTDWSIPFEEDPKFRIDTTFVADSTNSIYDRAIGRSPGEAVGPIAYRTGYILLLVDAIEAPRAKSRQEARADVLGEYQEIVENAWLERLRKKYDARLYPENLVNAFGASSPSKTASGASSD